MNSLVSGEARPGVSTDRMGCEAGRLFPAWKSHTPESQNGQRLVQDDNPAGQPCYRLRESTGFSTRSTGAWQQTHGPGATVLIAQISQ